MNIKFVNDYAIKVLLEITPKEQVTVKLNFFTKLLHNGLIDHQRLRKGCINHFYDKVCKDSGGANRFAILDTAIEFDCTTKTIYNVVYKFNKIRLIF